MAGLSDEGLRPEMARIVENVYSTMLGSTAAPAPPVSADDARDGPHVPAETACTAALMTSFAIAC